MKNLFYILFLFIALSCDKSDTKVITSKSGVTISSNRLAALQKPMPSIQWSPKLMALPKENQLEALSKIQMKLSNVGYTNPEVMGVDWKEASIKANVFLGKESENEYLKELQQSTAQYILLQTNILDDNSPEAKKEVAKNLLLMSESGSSSIAVVHYVFAEYGKNLDENLKKVVAKSVSKTFKENVIDQKLSDKDKIELGKVNNDLLKRIEYQENSNQIAQKELSKY